MKKNSLIFNVMKAILFFICTHSLLLAESPDYPGDCNNPTAANTFNFTSTTSTISKYGNVTYTRYWNWYYWVYTEDNDYFLVTTPQAGTLTITINGSNTFFTATNNACPTRNSPSRTTYTIHLDSTTTNFNIGVFSNLYSSPDYTLSVTFTPDIITPSFSIADVTMNEGSSGMYTKKIPVTLSNANGSTFTVNYTTSNGTAINGSDYNATSGTLTFSGTTTTQNIPVKINGDTTNESDEYFYIILSNATGGATIKDNSATITLLNDDGGAIHSGGRDFLIRNPISTQNIKGNIKVIGNTVLCYKNNNGQCIDTDLANNQVSLNFINTNNVTYPYKNSSQAQIAGVPATAKVVWAGFYTQGYLAKNYNDTTSTLTSTPAYLITPQGTTIAVSPDVIDVYPYTSSQYTYSTFSAVPSLVGLTGSQVNGYFTGANIKAREGDDSSALGYFGAWSLVIIYEDSTESLKNISVFDGYKQVGKSTETISVNGFLTPTSGDVKSTVSVFVGEGDKNIDGDTISLNNVQIPDSTNNNAFNSTVNGFLTNPDPINYQGIDIHNYDVGVDGSTSHEQIIGNSEQSATIKLVSTGDYYYPSMVAFTTELYEPRVCYVEAYYDADGNATLTTANVGDIITIKTWIANMKKDASDGNLETAQKVEVTMEHDDTNLAYQAESTKIQNVGESVYSSKTDSKDSDTATFYSDTNTSVWHVGTGATGTDGGDLTPNVTNDAANKAYISFKEKIQTTGDITIANIYKVSYENSNMGLRIGDESPVNIGICKDFNTSIAVSAPLGVFNVVNQNFSGNTNSNDGTSSDNALYTQIAGQAFQVKLLALNSDYITLKAYTGDVNLSSISAPNYSASDTDEQKQAKCDASIATSTTTVSFNNENYKMLTLNYPQASKNVAFKIAYNDNGTTKYVCSRDSFAIRPATYTMTANAAHLIGGANYTLTVNAVTNNAIVSGYTQAITANSANLKALLDLIIPAGCNLAAVQNALNPLSFTDGVSTFNAFTYNNVGDVNVTVSDNDWTTIDQNSNADCLAGSTSSTPDGNGKVGCLIEKIQQFTFSPRQFNNQLALQNFNNGNFTYLSNDNNMSAKALLTTTAVLNDATTTATNYTANCYARNIDYTLALINNKNLSTSTTQNRIRYSDDDTTSNLEDNATIGQATFSSTEGNFTNGIAANLAISLNFTRTINTPDEPFKIARNDFNITSVIDQNNTTGSDFNRTNDHNATFYYGRVYSTDYIGPTEIPTAIRYEVYCKDCNKTALGITGDQSPASITWYQNPSHVIADGSVTQFASATTNAKATTISNSTTSTIVNGYDTTHTLRNANAPYSDIIKMTPSSWLLFNPFNANATTNDFSVEFTRSGNWTGQGHLGKTVDVNTSIRTNKRMEW